MRPKATGSRRDSYEVVGSGFGTSARHSKWSLSSGVERLHDTQEAEGSKPLATTKEIGLTHPEIDRILSPAGSERQNTVDLRCYSTGEEASLIRK